MPKRYTLPFFCPCLSPRLCLATFVCPCIISSLIYSKIFTTKTHSLFALFCCPFSAYGIRRFMVDRLNLDESPEESALKSGCCCCALVQDVNEMEERKVGVFKYDVEPDYEDSSDVV